MNSAATGPRDPKVSVAMITYNHERFISQAIESVLMQQTDFPVELVIGEDCSKDGTRAIVVEYAQRYPERIRLLLPERNLGIMPNFIATLKACNGRYVALCEGDDYWTDPHKLQKQVEFLDAHPECSMCFHEAHDLWPDGRKVEYVRSRQPEIKSFYELEDVVTSHFIPTASTVFRNGLVDVSHPAFLQVTAGDWMLQVMLAEKGTLAFMDENWSVRRIHPGGVASMATAQSVARHVMLSGHRIDRYLERRLTRLLRPMVTGNLENLCIEVACSAPSPDLAAAEIKQTIDQYTEVLELTPRERRMVACAVKFRLIYHMRDHANAPWVRYFWLKTLGAGYRPALSNLGYWSIGLDAFVGKDRIIPFRHLFQRSR